MEQTQTPSPFRYPPITKVLDYPVATGVVLDVVFVCLLLAVAYRFDRSGGALTIALVVVIAFVGTTVAVVVWSIPPDEETATVIGGLATAFGAVVAYWLRGRNGGEHPPPSDEA